MPLGYSSMWRFFCCNRFAWWAAPPTPSHGVTLCRALGRILSNPAHFSRGDRSRTCCLRIPNAASDRWTSPRSWRKTEESNPSPCGPIRLATGARPAARLSSRSRPRVSRTPRYLPGSGRYRTVSGTPRPRSNLRCLARDRRTPSRDHGLWTTSRHVHARSS